MADQNPQVWQDRKDALCDTINKYYNTSLPDRPAKPKDDEEELYRLRVITECLEEFAKKQLDFFYDGFITQANYKLNLSKEFPKEYVFTIILSQIAEDLEVIRRVADQRRSSDTRSALREADKLAWNALKPAVQSSKLGIDKNTTVMTYFQKSASIRVIPYASIALVGIPFTAPKVPRDYLAIPHEVGHYVYRHGQVNGDKSIPQALGRKLKDLETPPPRWAYRWKEEIFADVYGCLTGGPVVALSFCDIAFQNSRLLAVITPGEYLYGQFTEDDGVHPVPIVRPYVYTRVLEKMIWSKSAELINNEWRERAEITPSSDFRTRYAGLTPEYIKVEVARTEINKIIDAIFEILPTDQIFKQDWSNNPESGSLVELYEKFEETGTYAGKSTGISKIISSPDTPPPPSPKNPDLWKEWVKNGKFFPGINRPPTKDEALIESGRAHTLEQLEHDPRYTWNHVFLAGGWNTKGPGTSSQGILLPKNWPGATPTSGAGGSGY